MRLWSIHPKYLDTKGLVALWRESLLAQKILTGKVRWFKNHPQLKRFRTHYNPHEAIANYLIEVWKEAKRRGYNFDKRKVGKICSIEKIPVTVDQLRYEFDLLRNKLQRRDTNKYQELLSVRKVEYHPIFEVVEGKIEKWEKIKLMKVF